MARDLVEILMRARGGRQVAGEVKQAAGGVDRLRGRMDLAERSAGKLGRGLRSVGKVGLYATGALAGAGVVQVKRSYEAWEEHASVVRELNSDLKRTRGQANVTAAGIDKLANRLQAKTAVDDDAILKGAAVLLTFKDVRNEVGKGNKVFDRATVAAVDMSAKFGTGLKGSVIQLGKALQDPVKGVTALSRAGIGFSDSQKEQIKYLVENGQALKAQKLILREVESQVKGTAEAQARPLDRLRASWGDVEKELGREVSPAINTVVKDLQGLSDEATKILATKNLSFGAKLSAIGREAEVDMRPLANRIGQGLKYANLDDKLRSAIEWAAPEMAEGMANAAPKMAQSFGRAWLETDFAGRLITTAYLANKLTPAFKGGGNKLGRVFWLAALTAIPDIGEEMAKKLRKPLEDIADDDTVFGSLARKVLGYDPRDMVPTPGGGRVEVPGLHKNPGDLYIPPAGTVPDRLPPGRKPIGPKDRKSNTMPRARGASVRSTGAGPITRRGSFTVDAVQPVVVQVDGKNLAETDAKIRLRYRERG